MIEVIGVRFRETGKIYFFNPLDIEIEAYAIQAQNIVNGEDKIDVSGELSVDTLNTIYDTFVNQNTEVKEVVQEK